MAVAVRLQCPEIRWEFGVSEQPPLDRFMLQRQLPVNYPPDPGRLAVTDGYSRKGRYLMLVAA